MTLWSQPTYDATENLGQSTSTRRLGLKVTPDGTNPPDTLDGQTIKTVRFWLKKGSGSTMNISCKVYPNSTGSETATSTNTVNSGDLGTSPAWVDFNFTGFTLNTNDFIMLISSSQESDSVIWYYTDNVDNGQAFALAPITGTIQTEGRTPTVQLDTAGETPTTTTLLNPPQVAYI